MSPRAGWCRKCIVSSRCTTIRSTGRRSDAEGALVLTVLHVDTERGWRGGERQALWLASGMRERGHCAVVVARDGDELARRARDRGLDVISTTPRSELDLVAARTLRRAILRHRAQVVHAHTAHAAALGALAQLGT